MILYFDTSALMKLYATETGSDAVRAASRVATVRLTSVVAYAEMRSAFTRKRKYGQITERELFRMKVDFEHDWSAFDALAIDDATAKRAGDLAETYQLRGFDAVHLASAEHSHLMLGPITFACFDAELSRAASSCGMALLSS